jgi:hypothetical protein
MKKTDLAYLAGLVDGEGTIGISPQQNVRVAIAMTEEFLPKWIHMSFGGKIYLHKQRRVNWKRLTEWVVNGEEANIFLTAILPYLRIKKPQAEIALDFLKIKPRNKHTSPMERELQEISRKKMAELNFRGVKDANI